MHGAAPAPDSGIGRQQHQRAATPASPSPRTGRPGIPSPPPAPESAGAPRDLGTAGPAASLTFCSSMAGDRGSAAPHPAAGTSSAARTAHGPPATPALTSERMRACKRLLMRVSPCSLPLPARQLHVCLANPSMRSWSRRPRSRALLHHYRGFESRTRREGAERGWTVLRFPLSDYCEEWSLPTSGRSEPPAAAPAAPRVVGSACLCAPALFRELGVLAGSLASSQRLLIQSKKEK